MTGWEALAFIGNILFWIWAGTFIWFFLYSFISRIYGLLKARYQAADAWREGYVQGVHDERQAAAIDIPEYRSPNRQNPYGKSAKN